MEDFATEEKNFTVFKLISFVCRLSNHKDFNKSRTWQISFAFKPCIQPLDISHSATAEKNFAFFKLISTVCKPKNCKDVDKLEI